jgi:hypothetical protein
LDRLSNAGWWRGATGVEDSLEAEFIKAGEDKRRKSTESTVSTESRKKPEELEARVQFVKDQPILTVLHAPTKAQA